MTYIVQGLSPQPFRPLFNASQEQLADSLATRCVANGSGGFPCRVSLQDAAAGEELLLIHHVSNDVARPFRMAHAIYVRRNAEQAAAVRDRLPEMIGRRTIGLRAFDDEGMMFTAALAAPGEGDAIVRSLFARPQTAYVHAHNAAYGCFLAAIERD
jgi:hypothetical protein